MYQQTKSDAPDTHNSSNFQVSLQAIFGTDKKVLKHFIENGFYVDAKNKKGETPLHVAAKQGNTEIAKLLIENRANVNATNKKGETPLHLAAKQGNTEIVEFLIEKDADIDFHDKKARTPSHHAAINGKTEILKLLHKKGADIDNLLDHKGMSGFHCAVHKGTSIMFHLPVNKNKQSFTSTAQAQNEPVRCKKNKRKTHNNSLKKTR